MATGADYVAAVGSHPAAGTLSAYFGIPPVPVTPQAIAEDLAYARSISPKDVPIIGAAATVTDVITWLRTPANWGRIIFVGAGVVLIAVGTLTMLTGTQVGGTAAKLAVKAAAL